MKIEQQKLDKILEMLMLDKIFPHCPLEVRLDKDKNPSVISYQEVEGHAIFRYARFMKDYFKYLKPEAGTIHINARKLHKIISREEPEAVVHIFTESVLLMIQTDRLDFELHLVEDSSGALTKLPFSIGKDGQVIFESAGPLENKITMSLNSFKNIVDYGKVLDTDIYQFTINDKQEVRVRVGDLETNAERLIYNPNSQVRKYTSPVKTNVSLAMTAMANTFTSDITVQLKTNSPTFFAEQSHTHRYGVLIAPYIEPEA